MRKLAFVSLAALAAAALPAAAQAQPRAGHSWGQPGQRVLVRHGGAGMPGTPQMHRRQFRRIDRGHFVPRFWWGPQFQVQHWQMYGFPQPMPGHRWIRYYDDALMIDDRGRVHDGRYGFEWDRYGERWSHDERGIPAYAGGGDHHRGGHYDRDDRYERRDGWDYGEYEDEGDYGHGSACGRPRPSPCGHGPRPAPYPAPPPPSAYGYGYGYGAGYGYGGATMTITETVVETGGSSYVMEEVIEETVVRQHRRRAPRRAAPPPRRPIRGERG
jgi:Ni/Co efflux regulator RcnB